MLVYKLKISSQSNHPFILQKQLNYTYAFRKLYKYIDVNDIEDKIRKEFNMDSWEFESLKTEVETKKTQNNNQRHNKILRVECLKEDILEIKNKEMKTNKNSRELYKLRIKLSKLKSRLDSDVVFGGSQNLKNISYYHNIDNLEQEEKYKKLYEGKRLLPMTIGGETYHEGNRKFNFLLNDNKLIYKPSNKDDNIEISFLNNSKSRKRELKLLQESIDKCILPVTVRISTEFVWLSFDEQMLHGYGFDEKNFKKEKKECKNEKNRELTDEEKKKIKMKFYKEQESRMFKNKIVSRYATIDMNPTNIGFCIIDKETNKIINTINYDLKNLSSKLSLSSSDPKQKDQNNKRKYEITKIFQQIFNICNSNKVSHFVIEDLNFKNKDKKIGKEFNRKTNNIWHRSLTTQLITKNCNINGIKLVGVSPIYSSFIGNIRYNFYDSVNSSLEICRRGINKYVAGCSVCPKLNRSDVDAMSKLLKPKLRDDQHKTMQVKDGLSKLRTWKDSYKLLRLPEFKDWRHKLEDSSFDLCLVHSIKSDVMKEVFFNKNVSFVS